MRFHPAVLPLSPSDPHPLRRGRPPAPGPDPIGLAHAQPLPASPAVLAHLRKGEMLAELAAGFGGRHRDR